MYNSVILSWTNRFLGFIGNAYKESIFNRYFLKVDSAIKKVALNSNIIGLFIIKRGKRLTEQSIAYKAIAAILRIAAKPGKVLQSGIKDSMIVRTIEGIISYTFKNTFRIFGVFAVSFLVANITFGLISHRESRNTLILKLLILIISLIAVRITSDFGKTLRDSKFYKIFQWIIEVEK